MTTLSACCCLTMHSQMLVRISFAVYIFLWTSLEALSALRNDDGFQDLSWVLTWSKQLSCKFAMRVHGGCAVDLRGDTPLHEAAGGGHVPVCDALLSGRANPNVANLDAETPLHVAARRGYSGVVEVHTPVRLRDTDTFLFANLCTLWMMGADFDHSRRLALLSLCTTNIVSLPICAFWHGAYFFRQALTHAGAADQRSFPGCSERSGHHGSDQRCLLRPRSGRPAAAAARCKRSCC